MRVVIIVNLSVFFSHLLITNYTTVRSSRIYALDWIRLLAFSLLIFYHVGLIYTYGWLVANEERSSLLTDIIKFLHIWRLPLLFMISGLVSTFLFRKISSTEFLRQRASRLLVPFFFGIILLIPPQMYIHEIHIGVETTFLDSVTRFFQEYFSFKEWGGIHYRFRHLWFLAYLFAFTLVSIPIMRYVYSNPGKKRTAQALNFIQNQNSGLIILFFAIPTLILDLIAQKGLAYFISDKEALKHIYNLFPFLYGFVIGLNLPFLEKLKNIRKSMLLWSIFYLILILSFTRLIPLTWTTQESVKIFLSNFLRVSLIFTIFGYALIFLNRESQFIKQANEAVYPFYLIHQPIMFVLAYYIVELDMPVLLKFGLNYLGTVLVTWVIYLYVIKPINILRPIFGLKPLPSKGKFFFSVTR